jgi:hypothetical protein
MKETGVHVVLVIDNTSRHIFVGIKTKLLLPRVKHAQQSLSLAIPISFMEGELLTHTSNTLWGIHTEDHLACNGSMFLLFLQSVVYRTL